MKSISRKNLFLLADLIGAIGTIINMTLSLSSIIVGRIIMGISVGINSACVPIYIK
jgi:cyanate permease